MPPIKFCKRLTRIMISISLSEKFCCQNFIPSIKVIDMIGHSSKMNKLKNINTIGCQTRNHKPIFRYLKNQISNFTQRYHKLGYYRKEAPRARAFIPYPFFSLIILTSSSLSSNILGLNSFSPSKQLISNRPTMNTVTRMVTMSNLMAPSSFRSKVLIMQYVK